MTPYVAAWMRAFAFTVGLELVVAVPLLAPSGVSFKRRAGLVLLANLASHPMVWFVFPELSLPTSSRLALAETWAVVGEAATFLLVWPVLSVRRAFGVSALANGTSLGLGLLLRALGAPL